MAKHKRRRKKNRINRSETLQKLLIVNAVLGAVKIILEIIKILSE